MIIEKQDVIRYSVAFAVCGALSVGFMALGGLFSSKLGLYEVFGKISNAFTGVGILTLCAGGLMMISNTGFFDGLTFMGSKVVGALLPFVRTAAKHVNYGDYKERKQETRKKHNSVFLFVIGGVYLFAGIIFMVLYYAYKPA